MQAGIPDRLLGYTYVVNQSMASTLAKAAKVVLFGDFSKYKIRDVAGIRLVRLDELFAQTDQVGFVAFLRTDGQLLDAGTNPVKHLTCKK
jgi:HK97 family phage major capsid protein